MASSSKVHDAFPVGMVVSNGVAVLGAQAGSLGVVYEHYEIGDQHYGASIIFENGSYDGFSEACLEMCEINPVRFDTALSNYEFRNVGELQHDFQRGVFKSALTRISKNV